jgi:hypothetical protein
MTDEEREIRNALKPYMRFWAPKEHEELVQCLLKDIELRESINFL